MARKSPSKAAQNSANGAGCGNTALMQAMQGLRRSSAATRHIDRHAQARKGLSKGGRGGVKNLISKEY